MRTISMTARGTAAMSVLLLALALVAPAPGAAADPISPVGRYRLTTTTVKSHLVVDADHTFQLVEFGDSGMWEQLGTVIALGISSGPDGGCVLLGTLNATGISGKARPGSFSCGASAVFPMYAKRLPVKGGAGLGGARRGAVTLRSSAAAASAAGSARPAVTSNDPTGSYTASIGGTSTGFTVAADHTAAWPDLGESGSWAEFDDVAAFVVTSYTADRACIYVGRVYSATIDSAKVPGPYACPAGVVSTWHARRLPA